MKVTEKPNSTYLIESSKSLYTLKVKLSKNREKLNFIVNESSQKTPMIYKGEFSYGSLIKLCKRFRGYDSLFEISKAIIEKVIERSFELNKVRGEIIFSLIMLDTKINFSLELINGRNKNQKFQFLSEAFSNLNRNFKLLEKKFQRLSQRVHLLKGANIKLATENTNLKKEALVLKKEVADLTHKISLTNSNNKPQNPPEFFDIQENVFDINSKSCLGTDKKKKKPKNLLKLKKTIDTGHLMKLNSACLLKDGRLATCSDDQRIKVINLKTGECDIVIGSINSKICYVFQLSQGSLISSYANGYIRITTLSTKNYQCEKIIKEHCDSVTKVIELSDNRFASCSNDSTVKLYQNFYPYNSVKTLQKYPSSNFMSLIETQDKKFIVAGQCKDEENKEEGCICLWDNENYELEKCIYGVDCFDSNSLFDFRRKLIVGGECEITIISLDYFVVEKTINIRKFKYVSSFVPLDQSNILFGCVKDLWVLKLENHEVIMVEREAHSQDIHTLIIDKNHIISSSYDKIIKVWSYNNDFFI